MFADVFAKPAVVSCSSFFCISEGVALLLPGHAETWHLSLGHRRFFAEGGQRISFETTSDRASPQDQLRAELLQSCFRAARRLGMAVDIAVSAKRGSKPIVFIEVPCNRCCFPPAWIQRGRWIALADENVPLPGCAQCTIHENPQNPTDT